MECDVKWTVVFKLMRGIVMLMEALHIPMIYQHRIAETNCRSLSTLRHRILIYLTKSLHSSQEGITLAPRP